ncbi:MAG: PaaI family thioesterase [Clostridia bacterium]|nr:PaaI family thioesterase [Clostridia bacterium]
MTDERSLTDLQAEYRNDRFATEAGCVIVEAHRDRVVCEMPVSEKLLNAHGDVMGGAIFTLADFTFAVASNYLGIPSVAIECNIRYYARTKGTKLIAICTTDKDGRTLGHYTVEISDDTGRKIAGFTAVAFHKN